VSATSPRIWCLLGDKGGDNNQVETIIAALDHPVERRHLVMLPRWVEGKPRFRPSIAHLDLTRSDELSPPWPDLILTVGRRPAMAALWVRAQTGGRTRIVLVGKPNARFEEFDLIVTGYETWLAPARNTLQLRLPLLDIDRQAIAAAEHAWRERLASLPRPLVGMLLGGATEPYRLDAATVDRLLAEARAVTAAGGTPYLSSSRRTPAWAVSRLRRELPDAARLFCWGDAAEHNPYRALLAAADRFLVSADSVSMQVEVLRAGKPLQILPLPLSASGRVDQLRRGFVRWLSQLPSGDRDRDWRQRLAKLLRRADPFGALRSARDFRAFHGMLVEAGWASWVGDPVPAGGRPPPLEVEPVIRRIQALLSETAGQP
jgi:hypothetical protein